MKWFRRFKKDNGAVMVVEASFVFPIVFFVVISMIVFGNMLYQQAKMDAIAVRGAQYLATAYTNPVLAADGALPTNSTKVNVKPYRYLLGSEDAEGDAEKFISKLIDKTGTGFFSGMEMDAKIKTCKIKNYVVYQKACVEIEYKINFFPLRFFDGTDVFKQSTATAIAATDSAEFIRNVDMIMDYSESFGITEKIQSFVGKFKG